MTIEQRALQKYPVKMSEYSNGREYDSNESDRLTYIEGAIDQQKIDIEKACKWLSQNLQYQDPAHYNYDMDKMYADFVEDFKQTMEK